jgi:hypothetical protein
MIRGLAAAMLRHALEPLDVSSDLRIGKEV